ncbi:hypothetical protein [Tropicimonas sediminicola]|uniref:AAA+ family ATPase n=1 Tax=Tropicimonas sediminicola TaxID=1031541 RepID=A0A239KL74_9RHOB|nr:hypothetical protein [Tropicimonas sediminicola]SNT19106.1 hypothetical protein SAMN05421757_107210 [Tropicimonas sediminicola]
MTRVNRLALVLSLALAPFGAAAQDAPAADGEVEEGFSLIEEGAKLLLRGLTDEIEPLMEDLATEMEPKLRAFAEDFMPMLDEFSDLIGDLDMYHPPEKMPNGDIILRRKTPQEVPPAEDGEVDI